MINIYTVKCTEWCKNHHLWHFLMRISWLSRLRTKFRLQFSQSFTRISNVHVKLKNIIFSSVNIKLQPHSHDSQYLTNTHYCLEKTSEILKSLLLRIIHQFIAQYLLQYICSMEGCRYNNTHRALRKQPNSHLFICKEFSFHCFLLFFYVKMYV